MMAHEGDPDISLPLNPPLAAAATPLNLDSNGEAKEARTPVIDATMYPGGSRSLSSIALHGLCLGMALLGGLLASVYLAASGYRIWRLTELTATLALFHFLEFYTTARWNTANVSVSSFLIFSNGIEYWTATIASVVEIIITSLFCPDFQDRYTNGYTFAFGLFLVVMGQTVRSVAMAQAGKSFNHIPARSKKQDHVLVTHGFYSWSRHPSYFGYFYFAIGTQIVVGNKFCTLAYTAVLWYFFSRRIAREEQDLVKFFGADYQRYRQTTGTGIPFIR